MMNRISIIGLGYVGLPLALEFSKFHNIIAYDINKNRINKLKKSIDINNEFTEKDFTNKNIMFSYNEKDISNSNYFIITVPTPINKSKKPDLTYLKKAFKTVSKYIRKKDMLIVESTVYPGLTEQFSKKYIERINFKINKDFYIGYSPERINPGDTKHKLTNIKKIVSASDSKSLKKIYSLYSKIIKAGLYKAESIKIAEAAKVIENAQRDINVAFVNELSIIFDKMQLNIYQILKAANTKWNFLNFKPGLVGGHCIGVDPYYLTYSSIKNNYFPEVILAGRKINDNMAKFITYDFKKKLNIKYQNNNNVKILMMGITFKENCSDIRNSKCIDIYNILKKNNYKIDIFDPIANKKDLFQQYNLKTISKIKYKSYHGIIILVGHDKFIEIGIDKIKASGIKESIVYDFKNIFNLGI